MSVAPVCEWRRPLVGPGPAALLPARGWGVIGRPSHHALQGGAGGDRNPWVGWVGGGAWVPDWLGRSRLGRDADRAEVSGLRPHP